MWTLLQIWELLIKYVNFSAHLSTFDKKKVNFIAHLSTFDKICELCCIFQYFW